MSSKHNNTTAKINKRKRKIEREKLFKQYIQARNQRRFELGQQIFEATMNTKEDKNE
jgi:hypothetical protein